MFLKCVNSLMILINRLFTTGSTMAEVTGISCMDCSVDGSMPLADFTDGAKPLYEMPLCQGRRREKKKGRKERGKGM